ncbi:Aclacinomycin methylesterase RdmC [Paraconexibacter sp. AEG42_29]|uniref:Aclacinomycin methylesterase RdmC n=1 Tax=Paraconexibacter sp. AEG42_29 TaxID=2997339 RepID=A0AAU7AVX5_9ACTN
MAEQHATAGQIDLCYETFGDAADPTILLIMGLGTQMLAWRTEFCELLAGERYHVIRYDNRDVGQSTHFSATPPPGPLELILRRPRSPAYTLDDMADDAANLLAALDVESAHIVGVSMGGMIAQTLAVRHPGRVRSLVSIMSTTGAPLVGILSPRVLPYLLKPASAEREEAIARSLALADVIHSPGFERDREGTREIAGASFDRSGDRRGTARQMAAILASGDRTKALAGITAPTLVVHGDSDRMVAVSGGKATAKAIPGARLEVVAGMGHDLPRGLWPRLVKLIADQARAADGGPAPLHAR